MFTLLAIMKYLCVHEHLTEIGDQSTTWIRSGADPNRVQQGCSSPAFKAEIFYFHWDFGQKVGSYHVNALRLSQMNPFSENIESDPAGKWLVRDIRKLQPSRRDFSDIRFVILDQRFYNIWPMIMYKSFIKFKPIVLSTSKKIILPY